MDDEYHYTKNYKFIDSSKEFFNAKYNKRREKRRRIRMVPNQIKYLEDCYKLNTKPTLEEREKISENVHLPEKNIQIWFQNRRAKDRLASNNSKVSLRDMLHGKFYGSERFDTAATFNLNNDEFDFH